MWIIVETDKFGDIETYHYDNVREAKNHLEECLNNDIKVQLFKEHPFTINREISVTF